MGRYRNIFFILLALPLLVAVVTACVDTHEEDDAPAAIVKVGDTVPAFQLTATDGKEVTAASLSGKTYILNFFDTRCTDCQRELKELQHIYEKYQQTVPILNVPRSQIREEIQTYWDSERLTMPFHIPQDKNIYYKFANRSIPRTYVINGDGEVMAAFSDAPTADFAALDSILQPLIGDGNVRLSLHISVPTTRGVMDEYYFHNEYTISRLDIYFFDTDTKKLFTKAILTDLTKVDTPWDQEYDISYLYDDVRLQAGRYDVFAIANYDYAPHTVTDEDELLNWVDSITYKSGIEANIPDKGPVMTNRATAWLDVDFVPWVNKDYVMRMELERVMAKVQIGVSKNSFQLKNEGKTYAEINITNYKFVNMMTQYYLFQHKDNLTELTSQPVFTMPDNYSDCSDEGQQYVVDPLFYKKSLTPQNFAAFDNYYHSWFGAFTTSDFASMPSADNYGFAYILENTAFKNCQKNGYSPGIVFKAAVSPNFVYLFDYTQGALKEEYRPEYWPNTIYFYNYNFYGSIKAINTASGMFLDELVNYTDAQLKEYGIKQCRFNMGVYETYYTYWIRHRNSATDVMGPMQYGIVRNNFYRLIVTAVNGIGNSVITPEVMRDNYPNSYVDVKIE